MISLLLLCFSKCVLWSFSLDVNVSYEIRICISQTGKGWLKLCHFYSKSFPETYYVILPLELPTVFDTRNILFQNYCKTCVHGSRLGKLIFRKTLDSQDCWDLRCWSGKNPLESSRGIRKEKGQVLGTGYWYSGFHSNMTPI